MSLISSYKWDADMLMEVYIPCVVNTRSTHSMMSSPCLWCIGGPPIQFVAFYPFGSIGGPPIRC